MLKLPFLQMKGCSCKDGCPSSGCPCKPYGGVCSLYCACKTACEEYAAKLKDKPAKLFCTCKGDCTTKRCSCRKAERSCGTDCSKCTEAGACKNKTALDNNMQTSVKPEIELIDSHGATSGSTKRPVSPLIMVRT